MMMIRASLFLLLLLLHPALHAQEVQTSEPAGTTTDPQPPVDEVKPETEAGEVNNAPATPDSFKPSEDISEDLSVSFPVDI